LPNSIFASAASEMQVVSLGQDVAAPIARESPSTSVLHPSPSANSQPPCPAHSADGGGDKSKNALAITICQLGVCAMLLLGQ